MSTDQDCHTDSAAEMRVLQQLQHALPQASQEELAALLQIDIQPVRTRQQPTDVEVLQLPKSPPQTDTLDLPPVTGSYPPAEKTVPFYYLHSIEFKEVESDSTEDPDWYTQSQPFDGEIVSTMATPDDPQPLLSWRQLWPLLHHMFRDDKQTRQLDTRRLIRHAVKRKPLTSIPWQRRLRWPNELVLLVDYSRHLCPYFNDYQQLTWHLQNWLRERLKLVICVDAEQQHFIYQGRTYSGLPEFIQNTEMLYLGDLGCLDQHGVSRARWFQTGHQLQQRQVRVQALLSADPSDWDRDLMRHYQLHGWDFGRISSAQQARSQSSNIQGAVSQAQCQQLMPYLAQAFELTPALIRSMRRALGLSVSVESLVIQHPVLQGNRIYFQWRDQAQRDTYRQQLSAHAVAQAWEIIRQFESALPRELQIEQRQQLGLELNPKQSQFIGSLVKSHESGSLSKAAQSMSLDWIKRVAQRAGTEQWSEATRNLYALYWRNNKNNQDCVIPAGVDTTRLPVSITDSTLEDQVLGLVQQGRQLLLKPIESAAAGAGVELARLHWSEGSVLELRSARQTVKKHLLSDSCIPLPEEPTELIIDTRTQRLTMHALSCPPWASGLGRDRYGLFAELTINDIDLVMRWIPPGEFLMGSPKGEIDRDDDEGPQHRVQFAQGFWLAETVCSQTLWQTVMRKNPSHFRDNLQNPVENVSWKLAQKFISTLNQQSPDLALRLPSEAEWEYACRADTITPFWFGTDLSTDQANYNGKHPYANSKKGEYREKTMPVKTFQPNPWGLYQMHGNVWEWCEDSWHGNYEGAPDNGSAWIDTNSEYNVCRGGSWIHHGRNLRSACRGKARSRFIRPIDAFNGFRLARGPKLQSASHSQA